MKKKVLTIGAIVTLLLTLVTLRYAYSASDLTISTDEYSWEKHCKDGDGYCNIKTHAGTVGYPESKGL